MKKIAFAVKLAVCLVAVGLLPRAGRAAALELDFAPSPATGELILTAGKTAASIFVETNNDRAVLRAAGDLAENFGRVTGQKPAVENVFSGGEKNCLILGTLGRGGIVDRLVAEKKLDAAGLDGGWESYILQVVKNPRPGVEQALVIAGSDRRGTIFGIYQLSEMLGVSPWYWWADVPVKKQNFIGVRGDRLVQGPPAVKYRGIFLNDEDWGLRPWATKTFEPENGCIGPKTYAKIFELLLRLRANYLWPAMHPGTTEFNHFATNREIANEYGIVMGSSHCEQMLRNNISEWDEKVFGEYNFVTNPGGVLKYWEQRVRENGRFENIFTLGMRGIHDSGMPGGGSEREKAVRLQTIVAGQRDMLARLVNTNIAEVPQIFCPYKEVLPLYRLMTNLPDDITLVWPDDNYGYVRQFSNARERARSGGAGIYYHVSYWGAPRDYLWLCSTPPALIAEEMTKAFDYGADKVWILNVGDLKPAELDVEFFLKLAWNPHAWNGTNTYGLLEKQLTRDFGYNAAPELTSILAEYYRLNFQRKPEHIFFPTNNFFSTTLIGDEMGQRLADWYWLSKHVLTVKTNLPPESRNAFFELIQYPICSAAAANWKALDGEGFFYAYAKQGRANAAYYLKKAQDDQKAIERETDIYNNKIANGKWRYMMSSNPSGQIDFAIPKIPITETPLVLAKLGLAVEGDAQSFFASKQNSNSIAHLPQFNTLTRQPHFVDVFNSSSQPLNWTATPNVNWIQFTKTKSGELTGDGDDANTRVWLNIDRPHAPKGDDVRGQIIFASGEQKIPVEISVFNPAETNLASDTDFVEDGNRVVIEAEHASAFVPGTDANWRKIIGLGYNGEAVSVFPTTVAVRTEPQKILSESPCLQYKIWLRTAGDWKFTVRALPTFSVETGKPQRYAVALDNEPLQIISLPASMDERNRQWQENVLRNAALTASVHAVAQPGLHTLKIWMVDPGIVIDAIAAENGGDQKLGYVWPEETTVRH
jgi:hypothetical protein